MRQAAYRVRQFFHAALARVSRDDVRAADAHLPPTARRLFRLMSAADQSHGLAVMRALQRAGQTHPALLAAALLHDVGKSATWLTPVHRTIIVLLERFWPAALERLSEAATNPGRLLAWRRPFIVHRCHPELGAQWAERAGCDATCVALIRRHQAPLANAPKDETERLLVELQRADKTA